jgi:hypothetical protein
MQGTIEERGEGARALGIKGLHAFGNDAIALRHKLFHGDGFAELVVPAPGYGIPNLEDTTPGQAIR